MRAQTIVMCLLMYILLSGCTPLESQPTAKLPFTPTRSLPPTITDTLTPTFRLTATLAPGNMLIPSPTNTRRVKTPDLDLYLPTGRADPEWNGIPILPFAFAGEELEDGSGYLFMVRGNYASVERFYTLQMPRLGWALIGMGEGEGESRIITFEQGNRQLSIEILRVDEAERYMMVTIVLTK